MLNDIAKVDLLAPQIRSLKLRNQSYRLYKAPARDLLNDDGFVPT